MPVRAKPRRRNPWIAVLWILDSLFLALAVLGVVCGNLSAEYFRQNDGTIIVSSETGKIIGPWFLWLWQNFQTLLAVAVTGMVVTIAISVYKTSHRHKEPAP